MIDSSVVLIFEARSEHDIEDEASFEITTLAQGLSKANAGYSSAYG